jgi:hypothetical protein
MLQDSQSHITESAAIDEPAQDELQRLRLCPRCNLEKPLSHFMRRSGKRAGVNSRRGLCRACRKKSKKQRHPAAPQASTASADAPGVNPAAGEQAAVIVPRRLIKRPPPAPPSRPQGPDASVLRPTREGVIRMRGQTDKGKRWYQETDLDTASVLVREFAAVVVNAHTIRRLYSNKKFKRYILMRDQYTCYFCGEYGDTIDHLLPRAKGGHTTPLNCVCACNLCNQSKADRSLEDFMEQAED